MVSWGRRVSLLLVKWVYQQIRLMTFFTRPFLSFDYQPQLLYKYGCSVQGIFTFIMELTLHCCCNRFTTFPVISGSTIRVKHFEFHYEKLSCQSLSWPSHLTSCLSGCFWGLLTCGLIEKMGLAILWLGNWLEDFYFANILIIALALTGALHGHLNLTVGATRSDGSTIWECCYPHLTDK